MKISKIKETTFKHNGASFTIQELRNKDIVEIQELAYPKTMEMKEIDGKIIPVRTMGTNSSLDVYETYKRALKSWDNVKNEDGKEIPCDEKGKDYLYNNLSKDDFDGFYKKFKSEYDKLVEVKKTQKEEQVKN